MRSRILSAGLAAAFLPGPCTPMEGLLGSGQQGSPFSVVAPLDGGFPFKGLPLLLQGGDGGDPPPDEPVDPPDGGESPI